MKKVHLQLCEADRSHLQGLVNKSTVSVKVHRRASALLALDAGQSLKQAGLTAGGANYNSVAAWRDTYKEEGLAAALRDRPRPGRPVRIEGTQRAQITALAAAPCPWVTRAGACAYSPTRPWSWVLWKRSRTTTRARYSKKHPPAPPQEDVVYG